MATFYSKTDTSFVSSLRAKCTYSTSDKGTYVQVTGTVYLEHKGNAHTSVLEVAAGVECGTSKDSVLNDRARTANRKQFNKHTSWTSVNSKAFTFNIDKGDVAKTIYIGTYVGFAASVATDKDNVQYQTFTVPAITTYTVSYNVNGGSGSFATQTKKTNETIYLYSAKPVRNGYSFLSWNTNAAGTGTNYNPGAAYSTNANLSLYAKWRLNNTITYDANGGESPPPKQEKQYQVATTISTMQPTRDGYAFVKWNTKANGTGTNYTPGQTYSTDADLVLYAIWEKTATIYSVTAVRCDANGDEDDEGNYCLVECVWALLNSEGESGTVTGIVTPQVGGQPANFTFGGASTGQGGTAVALVGQGNGQYIDEDMQYTIKVEIRAGQQYATRTVILTRAFYVMDWKAGGRAVGIGRAAPQEGLEVGYVSTFDDDVNVLESLYLGLDTEASSGTDKEIYDALVALGWDDDVIV